MQAQTWACAEQRNPSQHSWHFCFHGEERIAKDRQCNRGCSCPCVCAQRLVQWVLNSRCFLKTTNLFKNYNGCFKNIPFSSSFVLRSLLKPCLPLCLISQNLYSQTSGIGVGKETNKEHISDYPGYFLCFGKISFIVIAYVLTSIHNKRVSKRREKFKNDWKRAIFSHQTITSST